MRQFGHSFALLLVVLLATASPAAWAVECSQVFFPGPAGDGLNGNVPLPSLPSFEASTSPVLTAANPRAVPVSNSYWKGGTSPTSWRLTAPSSGTARVYVDGNLYIDNNSEINRYGSPSNLIIVVKGDLTIANSNNTYVNAMIYVTGNAVIGNNPKIRGAISAQGNMSKGNNIVYDSSAIAGTDFGSLCENPDSVGQIDHFRFVHAASGLSCNPLDVQLRACATSSCDRLYEGSINVTLSPSTWVGSNPVAFNGGQVALKLHGTGVVTLDIAAAAPSANNLLRCSTADCKVNFAAAGLLVQAPDLIAGKPDTLTVAAASDCVAAFANLSRPVQFWSTYLDPDAFTQVGSRAVLLGGGAISGSSASPTILTLNFNASGQATTSLSYADAGQVQIDARYVGSAATGDSGSSMSGTDPFVSRPYGLCLQTAAEQGNDYSATSSLFPGDVRAGDNFALTIKPVIWTAASAAAPPLQAGNICGNPATPNYEQLGIALTVDEFNGGHPGTLDVASHDHPLGGAVEIEQSISEVGVFRLTATPPDYLGTDMSHAVSQSSRVGRFIPDHFKVVGVASLKPACGTAFSYQGQPMQFADGWEPSLTITAYSSLNNVTLNYDRPGFWKLVDPPVGSYASVTAELLDPADPDYASKLAAAEERDARLVSQGVATLAVTGANDGDGARKYTWSGQGLLYAQPLVPSVADYPFGARIRQAFSVASLTDAADGVDVCHGDRSDCQPFSYVFTDSPGSEVRLGRLRIGNAHGSELQSLSLPLRLESWQSAAGGSFQTEAMDTCTVLGAASPYEFTGNLASGETTPSTDEPLAGVGSLLLSTPGAGNDGSVRIDFPSLPMWLEYPWDGSVRQRARGLATFGIYRGSAPLIFRREVYR